MVTSQTVLQAVVARYRMQCAKGLCQNPSAFAANGAAVNAGNGTVSLYLPFMVSDQLLVISGNVSFSKP